MDWSSLRSLARRACGTILALSISLLLFGQKDSVAVFSVPFVGCKSDGQVGPLEAPEGAARAVPISERAAYRLAYYKSAAADIGVLAPSGWRCFAVYGSGGASLFVIPQPVDTGNILSAAPASFAGPAIAVDFSNGDSSGRYSVADVIGRVFPDYRDYAKSVLEGLDRTPPLGPYPADVLLYKSKTLVEFATPAEKEGLGTRSRLRKSDRPIKGAAILFGQPPSLLQLSVRLSKHAEELAPAIVAQFERDASSLSHNQ